MEPKKGISGFSAALIAAGIALLVVGLALALFSSFRLFHIPTSSMEPALLVGDHVIFRTSGNVFTRGDIVAFQYPPDRRQTLVKRLVAGPGDRLYTSAGRLFVNGAAQAEPYVRHTSTYPDSYRDNFPAGEPPPGPVFPGAIEMLRNHMVNREVVVPPGKWFVMGDNRDNSLDSRYFGFVDAHDLVGTPEIVLYSTNGTSANRAFLRVH